VDGKKFSDDVFAHVLDCVKAYLAAESSSGGCAQRAAALPARQGSMLHARRHEWAGRAVPCACPAPALPPRVVSDPPSGPGFPAEAPANDKQLKQMVMPFAKFKMEEALAGGVQVRRSFLLPSCTAAGVQLASCCAMPMPLSPQMPWCRDVQYFHALIRASLLRSREVAGGVAVRAVLMLRLVWGRPQVLDVKLPFDEAQLLRDNEPYLLRALGIQELSVCNLADMPGSMPIGHEQPYPGQPSPLFKAEPISQ
jgi:hypothetical protein